MLTICSPRVQLFIETGTRLPIELNKQRVAVCSSNAKKYGGLNRDRSKNIIVFRIKVGCAG
ncbi:hypothetical protein ACWG0P_05690 [Amedibacillus sp. YH-ame6]